MTIPTDVNARARAWSRVTVVTLFNVLAEYSLRGVNNLQEVPVLSLLLFLNYFPYFAIVEDSIRRYRLKDKQVYVLALLFGLTWQLIGPSVVYLPPYILGVNWIGILFVNFIWWVPLQTLLGLYLANRIIPRREWGDRLMTDGERGLAFVAFVLATLVFRLVVPIFTIGGAVVLTLLIGATTVLLKRMIPPTPVPDEGAARFKRDGVMDSLSGFIIIYFIFSAVYFTTDPTVHGVTKLNVTALFAGIVVSTLVVVAMYVYRLVTRREISV